MFEITLKGHLKCFLLFSSFCILGHNFNIHLIAILFSSFEMEFTVDFNYVAVSNGDLLYQVLFQA